MKREFIKAGVGKPPAVALVNPKYGHNVAGVLRNCSLFGVSQLWVTGHRVTDEWTARGRLPREERMRAYDGVEVCLGDYFFDAFEHVTPVAVEVRANSEPLTTFVHPKDALYVFGPEDGSLGRAVLGQCHRFVVIPTMPVPGRETGCLNLAAAVAVVLAHRTMQRQAFGDPVDLTPHGFADSDEPFQFA